MVRTKGVAAAAVALLLGVACSSGGSSPSSSTSSAPSTSGAGTSTSASSTTEPAGRLTVQVFFLDQDAFNVGRPPYARPVDRRVDGTDAPRAALDELFAGPTQAEKDDGLRFVASEATGFSKLEIDSGVARVQLAGGCSSGGSTFTVADEIAATLRQFESVDAVKIFDPDGQTAQPDEPGDSIPACLEP